MADHDHSYKNIFSHPKMVEDLLTGFVKQSWVEELDFSSLEKLNATYVSDDLRERADDVVWRVKFRDRWLYLYLLIEFQSSPDAFMAARLLTYIGLLYQDLIKSKQLPASNYLPPVFPLVIYNGKTPWRAAESLTDLMQDMPEALRIYQPSLRYLLVEESRYSDEELASLKNFVAALFRLENSTELDQLTRIVVSVVNLMHGPEWQSLRRAITEWLNRVLLPTRLPGHTIEPVHDLLEMHAMLAENVKDWTEQWKREGELKGKLEGMIEGKLKGKLEGQAEVLEKLLSKRFGELPDWATAKLHSASAEQIDTWIERIFDAKTVEAIFE